jgi:hypothetical protein
METVTKCPQCSADVDTKVPQLFRASTWEPLYVPDAGPDGMTFETKDALKEYCKQEKVYCGALNV